MTKINLKYNLPVITAEVYHLDPKRYELRSGATPGAPPCPYGHQYKWIGFDTLKMKYVRVTKSVFKRLIAIMEAQGKEMCEECDEEENYPFS